MSAPKIICAVFDENCKDCGEPILNTIIGDMIDVQCGCRREEKDLYLSILVKNMRRMDQRFKSMRAYHK